MNDNTPRIINAIIESQKLVFRKDGVNYFEATINQRTPGHAEQAGSVFDEDWLHGRDLADTIACANWEEYADCPNLIPGCHAFILKSERTIGYDGIISLDDIPDANIVTVDDRKATGNLSVTFRGAKGRPVQHAVLILGDEGGKEVVFTVHPGDPVMPPTVASTARKHGDVITVAEAKELGFKYAKLV